MPAAQIEQHPHVLAVWQRAIPKRVVLRVERDDVEDIVMPVGAELEARIRLKP